MALGWTEYPPPEGDQSNYAYGSHDSRMVFVGGRYQSLNRSQVVRTWDGEDWGALDPLPNGMGFSGRAAVVGDWFYFIADSEASPFTPLWWRYSVTTGVREQLATPSSTDFTDAVAVEGLVYASLGDANLVYDPDTDTWDTAPGSSPTLSTPSLATDGTVIVVVPRGSENDESFWLYEPGTTDWSSFAAPALPSGVPSEEVVERWIEVENGVLYALLMYYTEEDPVIVGRSLNLSNIGAGWSNWPLPTSEPYWLGNATLLSVPDVGLVLFEGNASQTMWVWGDVPELPPAAIGIVETTGTAKPSLAIAGRARGTVETSGQAQGTVSVGPSSTVLAYVDVDYDFRTTQDSFLTGFVDIVGGTGQVETILAFVTIPEKHVASVAAFVDVVLPVMPDIPPIPLAPEGNLSIIQPDIP